MLFLWLTVILSLTRSIVVIWKMLLMKIVIRVWQNIYCSTDQHSRKRLSSPALILMRITNRITTWINWILLHVQVIICVSYCVKIVMPIRVHWMPSSIFLSVSAIRRYFWLMPKLPTMLGDQWVKVVITIVHTMWLRLFVPVVEWELITEMLILRA